VRVFARRSNKGVLPSASCTRRNAVSRSNSTSRRPPSRTKLRTQPTAASRTPSVTGSTPMQRGRRIEEQFASRQLDWALAVGVVHDQRAAPVALGVGQKQREGEVGAHAAHERVIDMRAVGHAGLVATDQEPHDRLRPRRRDEHLVAEQGRLDLGERVVDRAAAPGLQIALDLPRVPAGGLGAVDEQGRVGERPLQRRQGGPIEQVRDPDQHRSLWFARRGRRRSPAGRAGRKQALIAHLAAAEVTDRSSGSIITSPLFPRDVVPEAIVFQL
jgi:hypothetical protein